MFQDDTLYKLTYILTYLLTYKWYYRCAVWAWERVL